MDTAKEIDLLAQKEIWAQNIAQIIHETRCIDLKTCIAASRWACLWIDGFKKKLESDPPSSLSEAKDLVLEIQFASLELSEGVERYPTGAPTACTLIAADDAFVLGYGDSEEAKLARQILIPDVNTTDNEELAWRKQIKILAIQIGSEMWPPREQAGT